MSPAVLGYWMNDHHSYVYAPEGKIVRIERVPDAIRKNAKRYISCVCHLVYKQSLDKAGLNGREGKTER